ncbi:prephenate dehydrogenase [Sphingobacterium spiritivorum]|uniref:Prephenate dehydrogenase n=1 Tax=Sphingobacterium spiritivorum ATCC 33861 TaxID=525373 RepID=D7VKB0_SPHSI|nr:prephenate dehydrogenase [Sphingobacterium spiritivorum]EFK58712.1 prephenate dehydrogenase [Sphingobacterium spiritivorum ATCC 33861]QQT34396.1 prephenate dehydrogenase [Sphingobacterium spiritivorum]WQD35243.1 prephenate dehydrogenase [Sphingobacterium spiritivorum]SUI99776.1 Arogenate dehydrogenase [Sphingobacterium spiritivorum]
MNLAIVGIGLIGGSVAIRLKEKGNFSKIIGVDKSESNQKKALQLHLVDEIASLEEAVKSCKVIILAAPVNAILQLAPTILDLVTDQVVIDMGSTKENILKLIENHPKRGRYVAAHPMAGTEYSGPEAAIPNLFKDKMMVYVEAFRSDEDAFELADSITEQLEMKTSYMNANEHDVHTAYVSHISHLTSFALALTVLGKEKSQGRIFELAGSGFESTVRLAKSSPDMWTPIFKQNRANVLEVLDEHIKQLQLLHQAIEEEDYDELYKLIKKSNKIKRIIK